MRSQRRGTAYSGERARRFWRQAKVSGLTKAASAFEYAQAHPGLSDIPLYVWDGMTWEDDILAASAELYRATGQDEYLETALAYNEEIGQTGWVLSFGQVSDLARHTLVRLGEMEALAPWEADVASYMDRRVEEDDPEMGSFFEPGVTRAMKDDLLGMTYFDMWGTCRYGASAGFSAALLHQVTDDDSHRLYALEQYEWIKGDNPHGRSFIVGMGTNPRCVPITATPSVTTTPRASRTRPIPTSTTAPGGPLGPLAWGTSCAYAVAR
jgi:hypothetical protein